jgi:hypothetical protein
MVALRHGGHEGFERVAIDFKDPLPPRISSIEAKTDSGLVRVYLDNPRPTAADGAVRIDVDAPLVTNVFYVVDAGLTWVDIWTKQAVDPIAFRLGNVAFKDGTSKGLVVVDVIPATKPGPWGGAAALGPGGAFGGSLQGGKIHVEGVGVRASGKGVLRLLDPTGSEVRKLLVVLTASAPVNGVFRTDVDVAGLAKGDYTIVFTSDDPADDIDGQPPTTSQVVSIP